MRFKFFAVSLLTVMVGSVSAQETSVKRDTFDVAGHAMMDIYRHPDKHKFDGRKWWENLSIDAYWAPEYMWNPGQYNASWLQAGVGVTKYFDKGNALRLTFEYNSPYYKFDHEELNNQNMDRYKWGVDWLWNLTNLYWGYNREDIYNLSLVVGASGGFTKTPALHRIVTLEPYNSYTVVQDPKFVTATIGLQVRKHFTPKYSYFVEPHYNLSADGYDGGFNINGMDLYPSLMAGFSYHLTGQQRILTTGNEGSKLFDNVFFQTRAGITSVPHPKGGTDVIDPKKGGAENKGGPGLNVELSFGKWINHSLALRLDFYNQIYRHVIENYPSLSYYQSHFTNHLGGRVQGDFNLIYAFTGKPSVGRLGLELLAGLDAGYQNKHFLDMDELVDRGYSEEILQNYSNARGDIKRAYYGPTMGFQLKYFANKNFALFVEPRYSYDKYRWPDGHETDENGIMRTISHWKAEKIYQLTMGMEIYNSRWPRYKSHYYVENAYDNVRSPWFVSLSNGLVLPVNKGDDYYDLSTLTSLAGGYRINGINAFRLRADMSFVHAGYTKSHYHISGKTRVLMAGDYLLDLTNLWLGNDPSRNLNLEMVMGVVAHQRHRTIGSDGNWSTGAEVGMLMRGRIANNWDIFVEPRYELLNGNQHWTLSGGLQYGFNSKEHPIRWYNDRWNHNYIQVLAGWQNFILDSQYTADFFDSHKHMTKGLYDIVFGRWMGDGFWAIQGSTFYHLNNFYRQKIVYDKRTPYFGGRLEAVFDVLHGWQRSMEHPWPVRWTLSGGVEGGYMDGIHENFGLSWATSLQYRMFGKVGAVAQVRLPQVTQKSSTIMMPIDISLGLQYGGWGDQVQVRTRFGKKSEDDNIAHKAFPYVQVLMGYQENNFDIDFRDTYFESHKHTAGPQFEVIAGHWLGQGQWGVQASAFRHHLNLYNRTQVRDHGNDYTGGRLEAVYDVLYGPQSRRYPQPRMLKWTVSAGAELGHLDIEDNTYDLNKTNFGFTMATQLQCRIWKNIAAVAQLRLPQIRVTDRRTMVPIDLQIGLQYEFK